MLISALDFYSGTWAFHDSSFKNSRCLSHTGPWCRLTVHPLAKQVALAPPSLRLLFEPTLFILAVSHKQKVWWTDGLGFCGQRCLRSQWHHIDPTVEKYYLSTEHIFSGSTTASLFRILRGSYYILLSPQSAFCCNCHSPNHNHAALLSVVKQ